MKRKIFLVLIIMIIIGGIIYISNTFLKKDDKLNIEQASVTELSNENIEKEDVEVTPEVQKINEQRKEMSPITTQRGLPVLMYHFFYDASAGEAGQDNNFMEVKAFEEQIKYLAENNYYVPTWEEVADFVAGKIGLPEKSVIITVDDGDESFFRLAVPVLQKYNFCATSFLITSWYPNGIEHVRAPEVDFQTHSDNMHRAGTDGKGAILTLSYENVCADLEKTRSIIGEKCRVFCYPFGHYSQRAKDILKDCNFVVAFTTEYGRVTQGMDCLQLPRIRMSKGDSLNSFISKVK